MREKKNKQLNNGWMEKMKRNERNGKIKCRLNRARQAHTQDTEPIHTNTQHNLKHTKPTAKRPTKMASEHFYLNSLSSVAYTCRE